MSSEFYKVVFIILMAVMFIVLGDTLGKVLTMGGTDPFIVAWSRFVIASVLIIPLTGLKFKELRYIFDWRVVLRGLLITAAIFCMISALKTESIANVFGAFFIGPIVSYLLAIAFLKERPSKSQTMLLALGFVGVMVVVKPGYGLTAGISIGLLAGVFYGAYLASTKMIAGEFKPRFLLTSQLLIGSIILSPIGFYQGIELPALDASLSLLLIGSAIFSAAGNYLLVVANRKAEASLIAPLVYSQLIFATVFGVMVFGDWPDMLSLLGLALIAFSGFGSLIMSKINEQRIEALARAE